MSNKEYLAIMSKLVTIENRIDSHISEHKLRSRILKVGLSVISAGLTIMNLIVIKGV